MRLCGSRKDEADTSSGLRNGMNIIINSDVTAKMESACDDFRMLEESNFRCRKKYFTFIPIYINFCHCIAYFIID